jgi:predicted RNase H-like HicB family nuclease
LKGEINMDFKVILEYDPEYEGYVIECPALPGCVSQGKTKEEALENIKDAIKGYLESLKKHNEPLPEVVEKMVSI